MARRLPGLAKDIGSFIAIGAASLPLWFARPSKAAPAQAPKPQYSTNQLHKQQGQYSISGYVTNVLSDSAQSLEGRVVELLDAATEDVVDTRTIQADGFYDFSTNAVDEDGNFVPTTFKVYQNYPNPFNASTMLSWDMKKPGNVVVKIYNIMGQLVEEKDYGRLDTGTHTIRWSPKQAASGMYIGSVAVDGATDTRENKKMLLVDGVSGGSGLGNVSSSISFTSENQPENIETQVMKVMNGKYKLRIKGIDSYGDTTHYTYTSNEFDYNGSAVQHDVAMIPYTAEHSQYYDSWLEMFKELTMTNETGPFKNTVIKRSNSPVELYGVNQDVPTSPENWLPYVREAIGDISNEQGRGWEDQEKTGLDLFVEKEGEIGAAEQGKTKVQVIYANNDEMPTPGFGGEMEWLDWNPDGIPLRGNLYLNKDVLPLGSDMNHIYAVAAHELGRAIRLASSIDPTHIMAVGVDIDQEITNEEANVVKIYYSPKLPNLTDMKQYTE